jgi:hypothetical protein
MRRERKCGFAQPATAFRSGETQVLSLFLTINTPKPSSKSVVGSGIILSSSYKVHDNTD